MVALAELALQHLQGQRVEHAPLDGALERACAVGRIVAFLHQEVLGRVGQLDVNLPILEPLQQAAKLDVDDLLQVLEAERVEEDDLVDPVQELRPEVLPQRLHHRARTSSFSAPVCSAMYWLPRFDVMMMTVFLKSTVRPWPSVSRPSSSSCSSTLKHLRVRLLDLVEEHDGVGPAPDRLGELPGLLVADVARRRADQPRHGVLLLVLRHVDPDHRLLVVEQELGERARQLGLADAGRAEEDEAAERPIRILEAGARPADRVRDGGDRLVLADDARGGGAPPCESASGLRPPSAG